MKQSMYCYSMSEVPMECRNADRGEKLLFAIFLALNESAWDVRRHTSYTSRLYCAKSKLCSIFYYFSFYR
jgi:hypothetical protein